MSGMSQCQQVHQAHSCAFNISESFIWTVLDQKGGEMEQQEKKNDREREKEWSGLTNGVAHAQMKGKMVFRAETIGVG